MERSLRVLREAREAIIQAHVEAETHQHSVSATIATFRHPRYEIPAFGVIADGEAAVNEMLSVFLRAFPDLWLNVKELYHADNAVFVEVTFGATHRDEWGGLAATGRAFEIESVLVFIFEGVDLVCEKLYLDNATIMRQLTGS